MLGGQPSRLRWRPAGSLAARAATTTGDFEARHRCRYSATMATVTASSAVEDYVRRELASCANLASCCAVAQAFFREESAHGAMLSHGALDHAIQTGVKVAEDLQLTL